MGKQNKKHNRAGKLRRVFDANGHIIATNAIDGTVFPGGIVGKNRPVRNYEIPEGIFKRELEEYAAGKLRP